MALLDINWSPSRKDLRGFSLLLVLFGLVVSGVMYSRSAGVEFGVPVVIVTTCVGLIGAIFPPIVRPVYVVWMAAVFPIGWVVSHLLMIVIFYLVIAPIGLMMRLLGHDPMHRRIDRDANSYWLSKPPNRDIKRYFRQF